MLMCSACGKATGKYSNSKKCRECYNAYMRVYMAKRYENRRNSAIIVLGGRCVRCGSIEQLEFDHAERSLKEADIGDLLTYSEANFQKEVRKCQLLCHNCHKEKTREELSVPHGGGLSGKKNCPCEPCKLKKAEYMRNYRLTR